MHLLLWPVLSNFILLPVPPPLPKTPLLSAPQCWGLRSRPCPAWLCETPAWPGLEATWLPWETQERPEVGAQRAHFPTSSPCSPLALSGHRAPEWGPDDARIRVLKGTLTGSLSRIPRTGPSPHALSQPWARAPPSCRVAKGHWLY